jgi:hypothetical protein
MTLAGGITLKEGAAAFRLVLAAGLHQAVIAPYDELPMQADVGAVATPPEVLRAASHGHFARPDLPTAYSQPANDVQRALSVIWEELLGIAPIGVDDDFFALGGHSLLGTRILTAIWRDFAVEMSLAEFFEHPTIRQIADEIVLRQIAAYDPATVEAALAEFKVGD